MSLEISGRLVHKGDAQQVTDTFKKREFALDISENVNGNTYANFASLQLTQAKCDMLDAYNEGDILKVNFNVRGKRYEKDGNVRYFSSLDAWRIEKVQSVDDLPSSTPAYAQGGSVGGGYSVPQTPSASAPSQNAQSSNAQDPADDLPF